MTEKNREGEGAEGFLSDRCSDLPVAGLSMCPPALFIRPWLIWRLQSPPGSHLSHFCPMHSTLYIFKITRGFNGTIDVCLLPKMLFSHKNTFVPF